MNEKNSMSSRISNLEDRMNNIDDSLNIIKNLLNESINKVNSSKSDTDVVNDKSEENAESKIPYINLITETMDNFDFTRVHEVMEFLDWTWVNEGIPSVEKLRAEAKRLLVEAVTHKTRIATGGFVADFDDGGDPDTDPAISLSFVIEDYCNY